MPDITMCKGTGCPFAESCYRFTAEPDKWQQAYFTTPPVKFTNGKPDCEFFEGQQNEYLFNQLKSILISEKKHTDNEKKGKPANKRT